MHHSTFRKFTLLFGLVALVAIAGGCKKKVAATPPAPPPTPTLQPTVTLNASPTSVNPGGPSPRSRRRSEPRRFPAPAAAPLRARTLR